MNGEEDVMAGSHTMFQRMMGAARLDVAIYEEVEADQTATDEAAAVVILVALAQSISSVEAGIAGMVGGIVVAVLGWLLWSGITYLIGDLVLGGTASWGELLRTLGFAQSPGILVLLAVLPLVGGFIRLAISLWILVAGIVAIRQALDFGTGKAVVTAVLGWLVLAVPLFFLARMV